MVDELTLRDVLHQIGERLGRVEEDVRGLRTEMREEIGALRTEMRSEISSLRSDYDKRFDQLTNMVTGTLVSVILLTITIIGGWIIM